MSKDLLKEIELLREKLKHLKSDKSFTDSEVVKLSREIDKLIVKYERNKAAEEDLN